MALALTWLFMRLCSDGLIRLSIDQLLSTPIVHLSSGSDVEDVRPESACGSSTTMSGFTEWGTRTLPAITIGWDWCIQTGQAAHRWSRVGLPRTNVMLVDGAGQDRPWAQNLEYLATVVDALPWVETVPQAVSSS